MPSKIGIGVADALHPLCCLMWRRAERRLATAHARAEARAITWSSRMCALSDYVYGRGALLAVFRVKPTDYRTLRGGRDDEVEYQQPWHKEGPWAWG